MRISRRSLAAAVVLGAAVAACFESEHLSSTAQEAVVYMPALSYQFGNVAIGSNVATAPDPYFTIRAQSSTDHDTVNSIVLVQPGCGSDFTLDLGGPLPAMVYCYTGSSGTTQTGGSSGSGTTCTYIDYQFGAHFHPSQPGSQTCEVDAMTTDSTGSATLTKLFLTGTGTAPTYSMAVQPSMINFGDVPLNTLSSSQSFTLANTGGATIHPTGASSDSHFVISPTVTGPFTLGSNGFQLFQVQCQTGSAGSAYSGTVTFTTGATEGSLQQTVALNCNALATSVSVLPSPADLGTHLIGDAPMVRAVTIQNTAGGSLLVQSFQLSGTPVGEVAFNPVPTSYILSGAGSSVTVDVQYTPSTERDYGPLGSMTFVAGGVSQSVTLNGAAHMGSIGTDPATLDFGAVCAGSNATIDLAVYANAGGDVTLMSVPPPGAPFMISGTTPATLKAHHANQATITATAAPMMGSTPGDITTMLQLTTNIPQQSVVPIGMHALVLAGGVAPSPTLVHFGPNDLNRASPAQTVTLTNCGSGDLTLDDASFTGSNAAEFQIVSPANVHVTIAKSKSQDFLVVMNPQTAGPKSAQLVFSYPGSSTSVALDGIGYGGGSGSGSAGTKDRETYYACSVGTPGGLMPLAAVGLLLRRRRRR